MSGFSADWLDLREDVDRRARDAGLEARLCQHFAGREHLRIVDLGCGTGANARVLAPNLPGAQSWRFVDHDLDLLAAAHRRMAAWGGRTAVDSEAENTLSLQLAGKPVSIAFARADLCADLDAVIRGGDDLVTAAAFFDLVSADWIACFVEAVAQARAAFYTVLIYDGEETWMPAHEADAVVIPAFRQHQQTDKGFGPAAGPDAADLLIRAFVQTGYQVHAAASPWRLGAPDAALIAALAEGTAQAVQETGMVEKSAAETWRAARVNADAAIIGHVDILALPPED